MRRPHQAFARIGNTNGADDLANPAGTDRIHGNVVGAGRTRADDKRRGRKNCNMDSHQIPPLNRSLII